jgi:hypothetical protein
LNADAEANDCGVVDWVAKTDCYSHGRAFDSLDTLEWSGQLAEGAFVLGAEVISCIRAWCEADRTFRPFCA